MLGEDGDDWVILRAFEGQLPSLKEAIESYAGFVVTGSHYSVTEGLDWMLKLQAFLRELLVEGEAGRWNGRLVAGCFGHQLLAVALGGKVGRNPSSRFVLKAEVLRFSSSASAALGLPAGREQRILESHGDQVLELPDCATRIACSDTAAVEAFAVGRHALSFQSHPELTVELVTSLILPAIKAKGIFRCAAGCGVRGVGDFAPHLRLSALAATRRRRRRLRPSARR